MGKSKAKITNWTKYNRSLWQRGNVATWPFGLTTLLSNRGSVLRIKENVAEAFNTPIRLSKPPL